MADVIDQYVDATGQIYVFVYVTVGTPGKQVLGEEGRTCVGEDVPRDGCGLSRQCETKQRSERRSKGAPP